MSKLDIWMPVFIADYLADTMRLNTMQHGAYLLLLFEYWRQGPLPNDPAELASVARVGDPKIWVTQVWPALSRFFSIGDDGLLHQKRIDLERNKALSVSSTRSRAARKRHGGGENDGGNGGGGPAGGPQSGSKGGSKAAASDMQMQMHMQNREQMQMLVPEHHQKEDICTSTSTSSCRQHARDASQSQSQLEDSDLRSAPPAAPAPPPGDARSALWTHGLPLIRQLVGKSDAASRRMLGGLLKAAGDDCPRVLAVLREAADLRPADPTGYITAALQNRAATGLQARIEDQYAGLHQWAQETGALPQ